MSSLVDEVPLEFQKDGFQKNGANLAHSTSPPAPGDTIRCDGQIKAYGLGRGCNHIIAVILDPLIPSGRVRVRCRRCGKEHVL